MESSDLQLLSQAGEELALLLELTTGYPDNPERLLETEPKASSVLTHIFRRLIEEGSPVPAAVANVVAHFHAPALFHTPACD